jgi:hypothetical protein
MISRALKHCRLGVAVWGVMGVLFSCGSSTTDPAKERIGGWRYAVQYTRSADLDEWVPVRGSLEFWFFQAGVFRQIGSDYIEPQFYDQLQACNGSASGT